MEINFGLPPYDDASVAAAYDDSECEGVGSHFAANPISPGDTVEVGGVERKIVAVRVKCNGEEVWSNGEPPPGVPPDHTHTYNQSPVQVEFWFE